MKKKGNLPGVSAFILILLFIIIMPAYAGVSPEEGRAIGDKANGTAAIIGETNLRFVDNRSALIPEGDLINKENSDISFHFGPDKPFNSRDEKPPEGWYKVTDMNGMERTSIFFDMPKLNVRTKVRGEEFKWVIRGDNITFEPITMNLGLIKSTLSNNTPNKFSYKLLDPRGVRLYKINGVPLTDINVSGIGERSIDTTGLDTGTYTLSIETDPDTNNGLDVEGPSVSFEVRAKGIEKIESDLIKEEVDEGIALGREVEFTVKTTPHTNVTLEVTDGIASNVQFIKVSTYENTTNISGHIVSGKSDKDGSFKIKATFNDTGTYRLTATELIANTTDKIWIKVKPYVVTIDIEPKKDLYYIGEELTIKGTVTVPSKTQEVLVKIEGVLQENITVDNFKYEKNWNTTGLPPGSYKIEVWALPLSNPKQDPPDASKTVILLRGGLTADVDKTFVAQGDDFTIKGTAPGRDRVYILTIAPKGGNGHGLDPDDILVETNGHNVPGLTHFLRDVTDGKFETDDITVPKDADTGMYLIVVLNYGSDEEWGTKTGTSDLLRAITYANYTIDLSIKTAEQILALIMDRTVNQPGSDDLLGVVTLKVEKGFLRLNAIENVPAGSELKVSGISNREVETPVVVTVEGPTDLKPKITEVKADPKTYYNTFEASFETTTARIGAYTVAAEDDDGHRDTTTLNLILTEEPLVNISTPVPTAEHTNQSSANKSANATLMAEAWKQPVFKRTVVVLGLLVAIVVAAWFVVSTRKKPLATGLTRPRKKWRTSANKRKKLQSLPRPGDGWFKR
ncbi:MAG: hypothetical protein WAV32_06305 [Halobacteriota archaeon]